MDGLARSTLVFYTLYCAVPIPLYLRLVFYLIHTHLIEHTVVHADHSGYQRYSERAVRVQRRSCVHVWSMCVCVCVYVFTFGVENPVESEGVAPGDVAFSRNCKGRPRDPHTIIQPLLHWPFNRLCNPKKKPNLWFYTGAPKLSARVLTSYRGDVKLCSKNSQNITLYKFFIGD